MVQMFRRVSVLIRPPYSGRINSYITKIYKKMQKFKFKKYIIGYGLAFMIISLASCLKENSNPPLYGLTSPNVISFQDNGGSNGAGAGFGSTTTPYPLFGFGFDVASLQGGTAIINAIVIYGPTATAPQDITLNVMLDTAALNAFNASNSTSYEVPDPTIFSFPSTVVIKKGQSQAYLPITLSSSPAFDFSASYAIPLTIMSTSYGALSANFSTEINSFVIKNKYDGQYSLDIETIGWGAYGISDGLPGSYPNGMQLVTAGASSVSFLNSKSGFTDLEPALTAGNSGATGFGATTPLFTFDPTTNDLISVTNTTPDDGRGRMLHLNPAVTDSRYDPDSKTIYAAYIMTQNGRPNQFFYDTLVYTGGR
jgi:hypothetical protein